MTDNSGSSGTNKSATVIKKYANRRLYNTATSTYVTLEDLALMVRNGSDFVVYDAKTGDDITRSVLTQIIFDEENKGGAQTLLPINFLRQLIRFYGDAMQGVVPGYLEMSIDSLTRDQDKIREQMSGAFGGSALKGLEEQAKRNMEIFQEAMKTFNPFLGALTGGMGGSAASTQGEAQSKAAPASAPPNDDLQAMKDQLAAMQKTLAGMTKL